MDPLFSRLLDLHFIVFAPCVGIRIVRDFQNALINDISFCSHLFLHNYRLDLFDHDRILNASIFRVVLGFNKYHCRSGIRIVSV